MKPCSRCKQEKPFSEYYKHSGTPSGLQSDCKACHREVVRKYSKTEKGRQNESRKSRQKISRHPEKVRARRQAVYAINTGKLICPEGCEKCFRVCQLQAHHQDYSKPYDVEFLCDPCHKLIHGKLTDMSLLLN
jgi:hypothetical protein